MRGGERRGFAETSSGAGAAVCSPTRGAEGGHGRALGGPGAPGVARHRARCGAPPARPSLPDELEAAAREAARLRPCAQAGGHRPPRAGAAPERTAEGAALHVLNSRSAFTNVCIGLKSRAVMLGKRNYLPGPNALTSWCIVLALVVPSRWTAATRASGGRHDEGAVQVPGPHPDRKPRKYCWHLGCILPEESVQRYDRCGQARWVRRR